MSRNSRVVTAEEVGIRLRDERRVLAVTHEAPDGDALGCLSAFLLACQGAGIPSTSHIPGEGRLPDEYTFLPLLDEVSRGKAPKVGSDTSVYFLDCATPLRGGSDGFSTAAMRINIDHHPDNPLYGDLNLVDADAPSATAILYRILRAGGFEVDAEVATSLYVGLVTDTGRFQYSNTTPEAHRMAAELQEAGCDVNAVSQKVYESVAAEKLRLLGRALGRMESRLGGAMVVSWLTGADFTETGAHEGHAEGLIDTLRSAADAKVAVLARERTKDQAVECKVSLRSKDGDVDVADLAHLRGGGGHVRAAGFTYEGAAPEVLRWVEEEVRARLRPE